MIPIITAPLLIASLGEPCRSESSEGREICQLWEKSVDHFRGSLTHGEPWRTTMLNMVDLYQECTQPNWDGYGAPALSPEVFQVAVQFVASIPFDIPVPEIGASSAGDISFEWAQSPRRIASMAISENGEIHYAALNGHKRSFGSLPFDGSFDSQLHDLIQNVLG
jgi:hypothetical protein